MTEESISSTIYYVFYGRFPSEKAHALYVAKVAEAFSQFGNKVKVIVPKRPSRSSHEVFFKTECAFEVVRLPTIDLDIRKGKTRTTFFLSYLIFSIGVFFYFLKNKEKGVTFTNNILPAFLLSFQQRDLVFEVHDYPGAGRSLYTRVFGYAKMIITQNSWKKKKLTDDFRVDEHKILVEPNAVDFQKFALSVAKSDARLELGLTHLGPLIVYTGHLFDWKGADVLAKAARLLPSHYRVFFIGGSEKDVKNFRRTFSSTPQVEVVGYRPHDEIPLWQRAADCLVLPNTARQDISKYFTSPMKLFEYMASGTQVVASDIPSVRQVVDDTMVSFVTPDDPKALAQEIMKTIEDPTEGSKRAQLAQAVVAEFTWQKRAQRITEYMSRL